MKRFLQRIGMASMAIGIQLFGAAHAKTEGVPALYATKAEAEVAAKKHFNCTGAHQMGKQWMPCSKHGPSTGYSQHTH